MYLSDAQFTAKICNGKCISKTNNILGKFIFECKNGHSFSEYVDHLRGCTEHNWCPECKKNKKSITKNTIICCQKCGDPNPYMDNPNYICYSCRS